MSDFYLDHYLFDNSKVYLQGDEKPPKGVSVHKGPQEGRYYNSEEVIKAVVYGDVFDALNYIKNNEPRNDEEGWGSIKNAIGYNGNIEWIIDKLKRLGLVTIDWDEFTITDDGIEVLNNPNNIIYLNREKRENSIKKWMDKNPKTLQDIYDSFKEVEEQMSATVSIHSDEGHLNFENDATRRFKRDKYDPINNALLQSGPITSDYIRRDIVALDYILSKCKISDECILYNGCPTDVGKMLLSGEYKEGDLFILDTFTSTSLSPSMASAFSNEHENVSISGVDKAAVILEIHQSAGSTGFYFGGSEYDDTNEEEVLLPRGTQLRISKIRVVYATKDDYGVMLDIVDDDYEGEVYPYIFVGCERVSNINEVNHIQADNSKVYLQDGDKPPKGAIVHKGPLDGRYYDPDERPVQYVHISPERKAFLSWLESQGSAGFDTQKDIDGLPDEVSYKRGYRDRFEIGKEIQALERIGILYRDGDTYHLSDEGKQALTQDGEIRVIDRIKREEQLSGSPFRSGVWKEQDLKKLSRYVNVPTFGLTEVYPPVLGEDLSDYTEFKSAGLVDHQPYIYYRMDEKVEFALSSDEIFNYCKEHSNEFDNIYAKEGRAHVMDELRKAHDAIRMNRHSELDLSSPVVQALIMDDVIVRNRSERIVLTEAGEKALKEGSYLFSLPKTQISQSITDEAMLGLDKSQFPVSNYFISTKTDITPIEMRSIIEYKANWFDAVNRALLRGTEPIQEETNNMIACLDNLLSRSVIKEACTLYNGCPTEVSNMMLSGEFSAGDILQLDTFTSTSLDREVAGMFSNNDVILKIEQPANSTGFFYGTEETEQEVLLPRGTQLRIKEIRKVPRFHEFYGGLEKDGSLTWDTLTDDEKNQALDDGYCEVPTKEHNFDTLSPEEQEMMGKTVVICERISGIMDGERVQADNTYKYYLNDGEQPRSGEQVHIGERDGRYVIRGYNPSEKIKEVGKQSVLKYTGDIDKELLKKIADAKGTFEGNGWKDTFHSMYKAGLITTDGKTIQITDDGLSVLESNSPSVAVMNRMRREEALLETPLRDKSYYMHDIMDYFLKPLCTSGGIGERKDYWVFADAWDYMVDDGLIELEYDEYESVTKIKITDKGRDFVEGKISVEDISKKPNIMCNLGEEWGHQDAISATEKSVLRAYKDNEYIFINKSLLTNLEKDEDYYVLKIGHLDNITDRCVITEPSVVFNGCPGDVGKMLASGDVKAGDLFQLDTYTSTSLNTDQANRFLNPVEIPGKGIYSVRLEIHQPAGSTGFFFGRGDSEEEVLLPRSTQIRIKSIEFTDEDAPTMPSSKLVKVVCERISGIKEMEVQADNSKIYLQDGDKPPKGVPVYKGPQDGRYYNTEEVPEKQTFTEHDGEKYPWLAVQDRDGEWRISDCRGYPLSGNYEATPADVLQWLQMEPEKRTPAHHHLLEIIAEQSEFDEHDRAEFKLDEKYKSSTLSLSEEEAKKLYQLSLALLEDQHEFLTPHDYLERTEYEDPNVYYELKKPIQNPFFDITDTMVENLFDEDEEEYSEEFSPIDGMFYGPVKEPTLPYTWMLAIGESLSEEYGNTKTPKWDEISQINQILAYTELSSRDAVALENLLQHTSHKLQGGDLSQKEVAEIMVQKEINPTADNIVSDATFNNINNMHPAPKSFDQAQNHLDRYNDLHQKRKDIEEKIQVYLGGPVDISQLKYILYDQGTEILKMKKQLSDIGGYSPELASQFSPVQKLNDDLIALQQKNYEGSSLLTNYTDIMRRENVEKKQYLIKSGAYKPVELIDSQIPSKNTAMSESTIQEACERYGLQDEVVRGHLKDWINGITPFVSRYMWKSIDTLDPEVNPIELTIGDKTRWNEDHVADVCNTMDKLYSVSRLAQDTTIYRGTSFRQVCEMFGVDNYSSRHDELDLNQIKDKEVICPDYTSWTENYDTGFKFAAERIGAETVWSPEEYELLDPDYDPDDENYKFNPDLIKMVTHIRFPSEDNTIHLLKVELNRGDHGIFIGNAEPYNEDEIIMGRGRRYKLWKVTKKPHPIYSNITVVTYELDMIDPNVEANLSGVMI